MQSQFLLQDFNRRQDSFGGSLLGKGHPKQRRPLDSTRPIHLVLKANKSVLRQNQVALNIVHAEVQRWSKRCGVTVYRWANVGNHVHLAIRLGRVHQWSKFIRGLTGSIARKLQARGLKPKGPLWQTRPFTRLVRGWRRAFKTLLEYIRMNQLEALGVLNAKDRAFYKELHAQMREEAEADWRPATTVRATTGS